MEHTPVQSSTIASVGYDASTETLEVSFLSGAVYQYSGVPQHVFDEFISAPSVGQYLHYNIKSFYPYQRTG